MIILPSVAAILGHADLKTTKIYCYNHKVKLKESTGNIHCNVLYILEQ